MAQKPPDLDAHGQPVMAGKPPDLPASGAPQMNVAIVNGRQVSLDGLPDDIKAQLQDHSQQGDVLLENIKNLAQKGINALPYIGGALGSAAGGVAGPGTAIIGAAAGGAAGERVKHAINAATGQETPETPGQTLKTMGTQAAVQGGLQGLGEGAAAGASLIGQRLMQSAVKPTLAFIRKNGGSAAPLVKTLLDDGINVSPSGVEKLRTILDATNDSLKEALATSSAKVDPLLVSSRLGDTLKTFATQVNPHSDVQAIANSGREFLKAHPDMLPVSDAQALKVGTYRMLRQKFGQLGSADVEAQKALARGLKEEIASEVPAVSGLNAREGELLRALDAVGRRVALSANRDPVGFAWVAHNPMTFLAALLDRSPAVKSLLARGLYGPAASAARVSPNLIRTAVATIAAGGGETSTDPARPQP